MKLQCTLPLIRVGLFIHSRDIRSPGWDTAGTESFRAITRSYYRGAAGCLLVYDVTNRKSTYRLPVPPQSTADESAGFMNARNWLADVREHADPNLTCILVANKVDLVEEASSSSSAAASTSLSSSPRKSSIRSSAKSRAREVTTEEGELWAKEEGLLFVEASAKSGQNVERAFVDASRDILDKIRRGVFDDDRVRRTHPSHSRGCPLTLCLTIVTGSETHKAEYKLDSRAERSVQGESVLWVIVCLPRFLFSVVH